MGKHSGPKQGYGCMAFFAGMILLFVAVCIFLAVTA